MKKQKPITINTKKVGSFLKSLNEAERIYLGHTFNLSNSIMRLIRKFDLTKKEVCEKYDIKPKQYNDFICGNWNYDLKAMSKTNAWFIELESKAIEEKAPVQTPLEQERREKEKLDKKKKKQEEDKK